MANYTYAEHKAQEAANRPASAGRSNAEMHFMGEFLGNDGDVAIIRFPYRSMEDVIYTTTHNVPMPGAPYGRRIRCTGDDSCEFCTQGIKVETRVFIKCLVYTVDEKTGTVKLNNTVWDRPSAFADIDLKGKMEEAAEDFGTSLDQLLVKIKRNGKGTSTRYDLSLSLNNNRAVYDPAVYRADFSELEQIDAIKVLSKSLTQYHEMLNPGSTKSVEQTSVQETVVQKPVETTFNQPPVETVFPKQTTEVEQPKSTTGTQTVRYKF